MIFRGKFVFWMTGGIGNQLFIYAAARSYQLKYGVNVVFDLSNYKTDFRSYKLNNFGLELRIATHWDLLFYRVKVRKLMSCLFFFKKSLFRINIEEHFGFFYDNLFAGRYQYFKGYWQCYEYYKDILETTKNEIKLDNSFKNEDYMFWYNLITNTKSVSVHIRRSDYLLPLNNGTFVELDADYYENCLNKCILIDSNCEFFVFSDEENWVKNNIEFPLNVKVHFVSGSINCDFIEFDLMRHCQINIIANSTFSWWSASLNINKHALCFAPKNYFKIKELNDLYINKTILHNPNFEYV